MPFPVTLLQIKQECVLSMCTVNFFMFPVYQTSRQCLDDGPFVFDCNNRDPSYIIHQSARIIITRDPAQGCSTNFIDVCELVDLSEDQNVRNCTVAGCEVDPVDVEQADISACETQGYSGFQILEVTYMCQPRKLSSCLPNLFYLKEIRQC